MTYNAKSETVAEKPSFRGAMKNGHRCLIPVSGFFEWQHVGKVKYPYFIHLKSDHFFRLAGIYENGTYSILTTGANPLMARIHNRKQRMPVILTEVDGEAWLDPTLSAADVKQLCIPYPADDMEAWTVSRDITSRTANPDTPAAHRLMEYPELGGADGRLVL
jgi:putative SOS response-associated peptidase YedK